MEFYDREQRPMRIALLYEGVLGAGDEGIVFAVRAVGSSQPLALKVTRANSDEVEAHTLALDALGTSHIVQLVGFTHVDAGRTLDDIFVSFSAADFRRAMSTLPNRPQRLVALRTGRLARNATLILMQRLANTLTSSRAERMRFLAHMEGLLHEVGIDHGDLSERNVLEDGSGSLKLIDFGQARVD